MEAVSTRRPSRRSIISSKRDCFLVCTSSIYTVSCLSRRLSTRLQSLRGGRDVSLQLDLLLPLHRRAFSGAHSLPPPSSLILGFKVAPDCFEKLAKYCDPQLTMNLQYIDLRNFGLGDDGLLLICELINHYFLPNVITLLLDSFLSSLCFDSRQ